MPYRSVQERAKILELYNSGNSQNSISKTLKVPKSSVHNIINRYKDSDGRYEDKKRQDDAKNWMKKPKEELF